MTSLALGVPLIMVTVLGLLLNGYILLVVVLAKQVHTFTVSFFLSLHDKYYNCICISAGS
jgi:hypothetical protein